MCGFVKRVITWEVLDCPDRGKLFAYISGMSRSADHLLIAASIYRHETLNKICVLKIPPRMHVRERYILQVKHHKYDIDRANSGKEIHARVKRCRYTNTVRSIYVRSEVYSNRNVYTRLLISRSQLARDVVLHRVQTKIQKAKTGIWSWSLTPIFVESKETSNGQNIPSCFTLPSWPKQARTYTLAFHDCGIRVFKAFGSTNVQSLFFPTLSI